MDYEVEQKFPLASPDDAERRLAQLGARFGEPIQQVDQYYRHPVRDFAVTDEALRIRRVGDRNRITYKGPRLDRLTKTRRELELPLEAGEQHFSQFSELLQALGFEPSLQVRKRRRAARLSYRQQAIEVVLDSVDSLGEYLELEIVCGEQGLATAREALLALAAELELGPPEPRSYLEMLLARSDHG